jgi:hypothetical protein
MARHKFTRADRIRGIEGALRSRKTPAHLKAGLRKALKKLK